MSDDHLSEKQRGKRPMRYEEDARSISMRLHPPEGLNQSNYFSDIFDEEVEVEATEVDAAEVDEEYEPAEVRQLSGNKRAARIAGLMGLVNSQDCVDRSDDLQEIDYDSELELIKEDYHHSTHKIENCASSE